MSSIIKTWKVIYQNVPYNYSSPRTLVIEAESIEAAMVTAYDCLTRRGLVIAVDSVGYDLRNAGQELDWEAAKALGWPPPPTNGDTHIRSIVEHALVAAGRVVGDA